MYAKEPKGGVRLSFKISLEAARINAGLTQADVGRVLHVDKHTVGNWERGKSSPTIQQFRELCELYKCPQELISLP